MAIIFSILMILLILFQVYCIYQFFRNSAVFNIRTKWINSDDERYYKYTYDEMFNPSKSNYYGLRYPKEKHYK